MVGRWHWWNCKECIHQQETRRGKRVEIEIWEGPLCLKYREEALYIHLQYSTLKRYEGAQVLLNE